MTDTMKLIARLRDPREQDEGLCVDAADAIEALQGEVERLKALPMKYKRMEFNAQLQEENAALRAKLDELQRDKVELGQMLLNLRDTANATVEALQAKLDELTKQEPAKWTPEEIEDGITKGTQ